MFIRYEHVVRINKTKKKYTLIYMNILYEHLPDLLVSI